MDAKQLINNLQNEFNSIWKYKMRGNTIEVIVPYATTSHKFVSVFLSIKDNEFIISDGGWITSGIYDTVVDEKEESVKKILEHYKDAFDLQTTEAKGTVFYFKKTTKELAIASCIFDLSLFISSILSVSEVAFTSQAERISKERFNTKVKIFLESRIDSHHLKVNTYLNDHKKVKFNSIVTPKPNELVLITNITGASKKSFESDIARSNFLFELAQKSPESPYIKKRLAVIDDEAKGYDEEELGVFLTHLKDNMNVNAIPWKEKQLIIAEAYS